MCGCSGIRQNHVYDARYQGKVKIEYPLHPLFGRAGTIVRRVRQGNTLFWELTIDERPVTVVQWMIRQDLCQHLTCGHDPYCDENVLMELVALLDATDS